MDFGICSCSGPTLFVRGSDDTLVMPLGCCMGANVLCHTWWSLVWSRSEYKAMGNAIVGMYNAVFVVKLIVSI